jgi:hypothetical protein
MNDVERDPVVRRAIDELRKVPATDADAVGRVVAAAAAARVAPAADDPMVVHRARRGPQWMVGGLAAAAIVASVFVINARRAALPVTATAAASATLRSDSGASVIVGPLQPVANNAGDALPVLQQFVFYSRTARTVSVVGDFNEWDASRARMTRASDGDLWSITMPVIPGRHMYGFMVDDSSFALDPHAQTARDPDLGSETSVIVVGKP